jgi:hypothetical protein
LAADRKISSAQNMIGAIRRTLTAKFVQNQIRATPQQKDRIDKPQIRSGADQKADKPGNRERRISFGASPSARRIAF